LGFRLISTVFQRDSQGTEGSKNGCQPIHRLPFAEAFMRKMLVVFFSIVLVNMVCSQTGPARQSPQTAGTPQYFKTKSFTSSNRINLSDINDFWKIINSHRVQNVFYTEADFIFELKPPRLRINPESQEGEFL
jgi:hypothetical protein